MSVAPHSSAHTLLELPGDPRRVGHYWLDTLADVPLFQGLSKRQLRRIAKLARIRRFADGSAMVRAGDAGRAFYVLLDGGAKVTRAGSRSVRLGAGAFFGEMALIDDSPRSADVVANGDVLALTIDRPGFTKLLRAEPALSLTLLRTLAARLRAAEAAD